MKQSSSSPRLALLCTRQDEDSLVVDSTEAPALEWTIGGRPIVVRGHADLSNPSLRLDAQSPLSVRARCDRSRADANGLSLESEHGGFAHLRGAPRTIRRIEGDARDLRVDDRIEGGVGQVARAELLLHPDVTLERASSGFLLRNGAAVGRLTTFARISLEEVVWDSSRNTVQLLLEYGPVPCLSGFRLTALSRVATAPPVRLAA